MNHGSMLLEFYHNLSLPEAGLFVIMLGCRVCRMLHGMCGPCKIWPIVPTTSSRYLCRAEGEGLSTSLHYCIIALLFPLGCESHYFLAIGLAHNWILLDLIVNIK
jgi:hypothetical protein